jgi:D-alanyl-D-alanine carboxypeptidase
MPQHARPSEGEVAVPRQPAAWRRLALPAVALLLLVGVVGTAMTGGGGLQQAAAGLLGRTVVTATQAPLHVMTGTLAAATLTSVAPAVIAATFTAAPATRTTATPPPTANLPPSATPTAHLPPDVVAVATVDLPDGIVGRLRDAPNGQVIGAVAGKVAVHVLSGRETTSDLIVWVRIRIPSTGQTGWFAEALLDYTPTPMPSNTPVGLGPTAPSTATPISGATLTGDQAGCASYGQVPPDLLTYVSKDQGLARDFRPADLAIVPLAPKNQAFQPIPLRRGVHQPLLAMLDAMNQAGLSVWVMSGYRSYGDQQLAYEKWQQLYPDRAPDISAVPGHSEHQLGTAVDFSTPYMDNLFGDFFNVRFSNTPEGQWLSQQAANYGFTLSYPSGATQITGYAWEPWHFRYVGTLALELVRRNVTLTQYLQACASRGN